MPDSEFRVMRDQFAVRAALLQFVARRGYTLGRKPDYHRSVVIERHATALELGLIESEKFHYRRDYRNQDIVILEVRVDFFAPRGASGTVVRLRFNDTCLEAAMAYDVQAFLMHAQSYVAGSPPICAKCSSAVRNMTAAFCGKCGASLHVNEAEASKAVAEAPVEQSELPDVDSAVGSLIE